MDLLREVSNVKIKIYSVESKINHPRGWLVGVNLAAPIKLGWPTQEVDQGLIKMILRRRF